MEMFQVGETINPRDLGRRLVRIGTKTWEQRVHANELRVLLAVGLGGVVRLSL